MSTILQKELVQNGELIQGYDTVHAAEWCSPSFLKSKVCTRASAEHGEVTLEASLKTPFGSYTKSFTFDSNVSFIWQPFSKLKVTFTITNLSIDDDQVSFDISAKISIKVPFLGWKSKTFTHHFEFGTLLHSEVLNSIDEATFASLLAIQE
ncbi:hypothetical protein CXF68_19185 [Tenacibaculum sp. Bg11-29]|uniref:hypothetical protein n=1 Tax=Tenacibaculum sp. Bg11-29 TaxID=2058306 RepID=UPI000C31F4E8|nr:hypothetical protein [Tenacibaculum sp. Bg11-29]PKH52684.1 hypothetical protein CXF68_19185 [Tenacibaculum sp. Bg11-29]